MSKLNVIKKEREEKDGRSENGYPINSEIYNLLIKESEGPTYIATRTRIAICLLTRISELLPLKVGQLETLVAEGWISIDRLKRGPSNHKAFLTSEGFEFLFLMILCLYLRSKTLRRETVNKVMNAVSKCLPSPRNWLYFSIVERYKRY